MRALLVGPLVLLGLGVLNGNGSAYAFSDPLPVVTGVRPNVGPGTGGSSVAIIGTSFTGATAVKFGQTEATGVTVMSKDRITAASPTGTGTVDVTVTTPEGTSATGPADRFAYLPVVSGVSPGSGPAAGGAAVTIVGVDFTEATAVDFGSTPAAAFKVNSATSITAVSPPGLDGAVDVRVTTPQGTSRPVKDDRFKFTPTVTGVSPNEGFTAGGTKITVTGSGFALGTGTTFTFGRALMSGDCASTAECTVVTPTRDEAAPILEEVLTVNVKANVNKVTSPAASADLFTYVYPEPVLYIRARHGGLLKVGTPVEAVYHVFSEEVSCYEYASGNVVANRASTDRIVLGGDEEICEEGHLFGGLGSGSFMLSVSASGAASIGGDLGYRNECTYEAGGMSGYFSPGGSLFVRLSELFTLHATRSSEQGCAEYNGETLLTGMRVEAVYAKSEGIYQEVNTESVR